MLTHDTKKALVQTTAGQIAVCKHLFAEGFNYVLLKELQSDRIEGEFGVYRQSFGSNAFMTVGDVSNAFKARLTSFAASYLGSPLDQVADTSLTSHECRGMQYEDAEIIEKCVRDISLSTEEEVACAYVAGWLERKCLDLKFSDDDDTLIYGQPLEFINDLSREKLTIPHMVTFEFVKCGLQFMKHAKADACCRAKLSSVLEIMNEFHEFEFSSTDLIRRLSNVLLNGLHKLDRDKQPVLYQTCQKKARLA